MEFDGLVEDADVMAKATIVERNARRSAPARRAVGTLPGQRLVHRRAAQSVPAAVRRGNDAHHACGIIETTNAPAGPNPYGSRCASCYSLSPLARSWAAAERIRGRSTFTKVFARSAGQANPFARISA